MLCLRTCTSFFRKYSYQFVEKNHCTVVLCVFKDINHSLSRAAMYSMESIIMYPQNRSNPLFCHYYRSRAIPHVKIYNNLLLFWKPISTVFKCFGSCILFYFTVGFFLKYHRQGFTIK
jgi:hypothetical protein